jgi:hypothetical protein
MPNIQDSLKKYVGKLRKAISELQEVEGEIQTILNNKLLLDSVDVEVNYSDLQHTKSLITEDPKEILLKDALEEGKNSPPFELSDTVDALEMMLNDDEMWERRKEEHKKCINQNCDGEVKTLSLNRSNKHNNLGESEIPIPIPNTDESTKITPLTRITVNQRQKLLYSLYKEALANVESLGKNFNEDEKDKLVAEESDKLLNIWINNH